MDRATAILERLSTVYTPSAAENVEAHNIFLQTLVDRAQQDPKEDSMEQIEAWYNENFLSKSIQPNTQTFVTLLRAAMNLLEGSAEEEAVQRFLAIAQDQHEDMIEAINRSPDFTDEEWDRLIRAQPDEYHDPPPVEQIQDALVNSTAARQDMIAHGIVPSILEKVKPVQQKGHGLDTLKAALASLDDPTSEVPYPHDMEGTQADKDRAYAYARQLRMEQDGHEASIARWRLEEEKLQKIGIHGVLNTKPIQALMYNWYMALVPLFKDHMRHTKKVLSNSTREQIRDPANVYGAWLEMCKPETLAALTVSRVIEACAGKNKDENSGMKLSTLAIFIGSDFQDSLNREAKARHDAFLKKQRKEMRAGLVDRLSRGPTSTSDGPRPDHIQQANTYVKTQIPLQARTMLGALAIEYLMQAATITVTAEDPKTGKMLSSNQAAFHHHVGFITGKKVGYIVPHHQILEKLRTEPLHSIQAVQLPMVIEPKPWSNFNEGGYYTISHNVIRQKNADPAQRAYGQSAIDNGDMQQVLAGLDVLGKVPWQINAPVLEVMTQIWNSGQGVGKLVPEHVSVELPPRPAPDAPYEERAAWGKLLQHSENERAAIHSQRCFQNFQLEIARAYAKEKQIFFPHSVDFRGRAYPIPPVFNHIGSDVPRSLLKFARGKELGTVGLQWLKIHLANLFGYDKASLKDREQFSMDHLKDVYDSATNPVNGERWWTKAEDPWQCLACCIELKNALDAPDPTKFVSHLPVHQDGTCNGLQHYAALGGDSVGARQVNLEPSDRPQDIYTAVADLVQEMVAKDAANGVPSAKYVDGHVSRKVVKRTVMTNVYGVTFIGAKVQVYDELKAIFPTFKASPGCGSLHSVALYVALKIFEALGRIFNGAQEIQYWLGECGHRITTSLSAEQIKRIRMTHEGHDLAYDARYQSSRQKKDARNTYLKKEAEAFKSSIIWTTPLQMPIVQPYRKDSTTTIKTKLQTINVRSRQTTDPVDKRKQLQAFPPNFIHSLDATHMLMSALKCDELGLDFAAVHDSFWTHASDIPKLNVVLRDAFVRMHSDDVIGRLAEEFKARYAGALHLATIYGHFPAARKIRQWRAAQEAKRDIPTSKAGQARRFCPAPFEEVALEAKRLELLESDDPSDVEKGKKMITPTSIWLENQDPAALSSYRLKILGESTSKKSTKKYTEIREKVLNREAKTVEYATEDVKESATFIKDIEEMEEEDEGRDDRHNTNTVQVWIPLTFPPLPKKGTWDVTRLRESKYFFS